MKKIILLLLISTAAASQPAEFETRLVLPLNDTTIEGVTYKRELEATQLHYNLKSKYVVVRATVTTYRGTTAFFQRDVLSRLGVDIEVIADNSTMVDSMGNVQMSYTYYVQQYYDDSLQVWKPGTPRLFREYSWYQFLANFQPVIIHQAILQAMQRWAIRQRFINL
jgi:hypothetical protein